MNCIITGCSLVLQPGLYCAWGDLFELGDCYIFNANTKGPHYDTAWSNVLPPELIKQVLYESDFAPFERRGVVVMRQEDCRLNQAAQDYVERTF